MGAGAAAGGTAGVLIGAAAGPVGALVGGALGAFAGGYLGREAAEAFNPTVEDRYWAEHYADRPYVIMGETYEYYRPAYHFGWDSYRLHAERGEIRSFDEMEPQLAAAWARRDASAMLSWDRARPAARDAWNRVASRDAEPSIAALHRLRDLCLDTAEGFRIAAGDLREPSHVELAHAWRRERDRLAYELSVLAARLGSDLAGPPPDPPGSRPLWMNVRDAAPLGAHAILTECERSEAAVVHEYDSSLAQSLPSPVTAVLQRHYASARTTRDQVRRLRDSLL